MFFSAGDNLPVDFFVLIYSTKLFIFFFILLAL